MKGGAWGVRGKFGEGNPKMKIDEFEHFKSEKGPAYNHEKGRLIIHLFFGITVTAASLS